MPPLPVLRTTDAVRGLCLLDQNITATRLPPLAAGRTHCSDRASCPNSPGSPYTLRQPERPTAHLSLPPAIQGPALPLHLPSPTQYRTCARCSVSPLRTRLR